MQDTQALLLLETAHDLSASSHDVMRGIARAARAALPNGPVAVARFDSHTRLDPDLVCFEGADNDYISRFFEWQAMAPIAIRRYLRSLPPSVVNLYSSSCPRLPAEIAELARRLFPLCVIANASDGSGLYILFGSSCEREWFPAQLQYFDEIAKYLAVAWRIRRALESARSACEPDPRQALRHAVLAQDSRPVCSRPGGERVLWDDLLTGRWSVLDTFTNGGERHVVAYRNPDASATLRALPPRERAILELALAGRAGKWIAVELQLSESTVTRALQTARRRIGVCDSADLIGLRTAAFEPVAGLSPGIDLAMARLAPARASQQLSDAERAVVTGILGGKRIAAIARDRGTSPRTVSNQLASIYKKLGVSSRREIIVLLA